VCSGARELLEALRRSGFPAGLVTGNLSRIGWRKMEQAGLREYFSVGAFAEDGTTRARVARKAYEQAKRTGLIEPNARVSLIGDHMNDVNAAKANGFVSIAVASGLTSAEQLAEARPDILVSSLSELLEKRFDLFHLGIGETER
jgi:phosphoglycolate phosphatase